MILNRLSYNIDKHQFCIYNVITMMTSIVSIGNSKGIRIPKVLLEQSGLGKDVELHVKRGEVRITSVKKKKIGINLLSIASEDSLAKDWFRPEEEKAWKSYQSDK